MIGNALFPLCRCALTPLPSQLLHTACVFRKLSFLWKTCNNLNWNIKSLKWGCLQKASRLLRRQFFYIMQKSKLRLVACLFSHEVHSMIRVSKSSMLEHWKTLQEGWVNALDILYDLFLILDNLLCKGENLNKYNTFSQLRKIETTTWFKRGFLWLRSLWSA